VAARHVADAHEQHHAEFLDGVATDPMASTEGALEAVFARWARRVRAPGIAWGLVRDGELAAAGGLGSLRAGDDAPPDAGSVFRIASMTKSFTGAALMTLVADGLLRLDDPVAAHVPELATWRGPTTDAPPLTVRHLVSMEAGLPTDDPWADRHIDLSDEQMDALIAEGAAFAWAPGTRFEYSNLGWGLVGRIIERASDMRPQELVSSRLLEPLGMTSTTWVRPQGADVAEPYRVRDGQWLHEGEPLGDGAIAPMGGLWTTVPDLARWVGFFTDAFPPRDDDDDGPLPRWARREMQQLRRVDELASFRPSPTAASRVGVTGYGIGLAVRIDERLGVSVGHSGGFPGYGSHMRWLPEHGVGVIGLSNVTYGNMHSACIEALEVLADRDELGPARGVRASTALVDASRRAASLVSSWNDADADALLADNVGPDEPYERRAAEAAGLVGRHGSLEVESLEAETPMRGSFTTAGGAVKVEIGLNHEQRVQWLDVEDHLRPSDAPIVVDGSRLRELAGTAHVIVRPVGDLAEAFTKWQGETLDRLGGVEASVPAAHVTLKSFGSAPGAVGPEDESRIVDVVTRWAASSAPIELRAEAIEMFEPDGVPVVRLAPTAPFGAAFDALRAAATSEGLPAGKSDGIAGDEWIPHLSLVYLHEVDAARRSILEEWTGHLDIGGHACLAAKAEIVAFDGDSERRLGTFPLGA
jgi:CubicO group peptidase (beta-lactamase class C family)